MVGKGGQGGRLDASGSTLASYVSKLYAAKTNRFAVVMSQIASKYALSFSFGWQFAIGKSGHENDGETLNNVSPL